MNEIQEEEMILTLNLVSMIVALTTIEAHKGIMKICEAPEGGIVEKGAWIVEIESIILIAWIVGKNNTHHPIEIPDIPRLIKVALPSSRAQPY